MVGVALGAKVLRVGTLVGAQVGSTVRTASTVAGALWASKLATPIRWALVPFNWFFSMLITGAWVPSGPWMVIWMLLGFASSIQDYKRLFNLTVQLLMHKEGAACKLCDTVIGLMLKFDQNSPEDIDCAELCPFSINACLNVCTKLVHALKESSRYPCLSVGMCVTRLLSCPANGRTFRRLRYRAPLNAPHPSPMLRAGAPTWTSRRSAS